MNPQSFRALPRLACVALALVPAPLAAQLILPAGATEAARVITARDLDASVRFLADDLLEGRGTASRGDALARLYVAAQLRSIGYEPAGENGGWEQAVPMKSVEASVPKSWGFRGPKGELQLAWWDDFIAGSGVQTPRSQIRDAEVVFVGYGIQAPEFGWDDFKGADLKGKVLLMMNSDPDWDPKLFAGNRRLYYGRWVYKYESAARQGAAGAILIHTTPSAAYPFRVVQTSWTGAQFELPNEGEPTIQVKGWATEEASRRLVALGGRDLDELIAAAKDREFRPVPLGIRTSIAFENKVETVRTANVLGLLRGSDPKLADEVVILSAHHDHLGIGAPDATGDTLYNGALDNAAGVAQMLAAARAIAALPERPRRSILVLAVTAEEQGLRGSEYFARHPTFPPGKIAANINYDTGNRFGRTKDVAAIGYGKSSLDAVLVAAAALQGRTVTDELHPDRGSFYRSDHFNLAKIGVPALYFSSGNDYRAENAAAVKREREAYTSHDYHQPSDEWAPDWNYEGMVEDAQLGFTCALAIANADALPAWNPGDEFEAARLKALAERAKGN
jgi:Zn-dependent M28 family amino/carboxypeptidase